MPKLIYKGETYLIHWSKETDKILLRVGRLFVKYSYIHVNKKTGEGKRRNVVDWESAKKTGALKGLPDVSLRALAKRYNHLKMVRKNYKAYLKRKKEYNKKHPPKKDRSFENMQKRINIFNTVISEEIKKKYGYKPRGLWTNKQKKLLLRLVERYRKSPVTIDWVKLMQDPKVKKFPPPHCNELHRLRKYYWVVARPDRKDPDFLKKRRLGALSYKYTHLKKYHDNQARRRIMINSAVNEFLTKKIGILK